MAQKAHKAMRLSLPPDVHEWLWMRKGQTGRSMHDLAIEAIRNNIGMKPKECIEIGYAVPDSLQGEPRRAERQAPNEAKLAVPSGSKPLADHVSPVPRKVKKGRKR